MKIWVVDGHPIVRSAISRLVLEMTNQSVVVELGTMGGVSDALHHNGCPDLIFMDLRLIDSYGVSAVREMHYLAPSAKIFVISSFSDPIYSHACLEVGASAYLDKSEDVLTFKKFLQSAIHSAGVAELDDVIPIKLSKRQKQLLPLLNMGFTNLQIALELKISEHTVKVHLWRLYRSLGVKNRSQACHLARSYAFMHNS